MIGRTFLLLSMILVAIGLVACGTIEVGLADEDSQESSVVEESGGDEAAAATLSPTVTATESAPVESTSAPTPPTATAEVETAVTPTAESAPAGWERFHADEYGIELWHPQGTTVVIGEPARPEFSSVDYPEGIVEEQLFVATVMQGESGSFGPPGPMAILEVKLVANPESKSAGEMADLFSKRCPGPVQDPLQPTTVAVQLSGYRYGCEGIDGVIFNEFWSTRPGDPQQLFGAVWANMSAPLADEILATVTFTE